MTYTDEMWPDGKTRRRVYEDKTVKIHHRCDICEKWYMYKDTGSVARYRYCVNCKDEFPEYIKRVDPGLYESVKHLGVWRKYK